ncbi:transmembrane protein 223-like [Tachyglossus aculeatus]|uniref:transmembrane protein 223-like n=1 Tax=Tachyglossus aculeatus TaxID=9261 RepID=UPI0018F6DFA7|nr:transmembrane protein 223-like [Tachyglossus aculeatus]
MLARVGMLEGGQLCRNGPGPWCSYGNNSIFFYKSIPSPARSPPSGPEAEAEAEVAPARRGPARGSALWRHGLTLPCAATGSLVLTAGLLFSNRSVHSVLLRAGGQRVTVTTHGPFGLGAEFTVPLRHVSCLAHRGEVPAVLPLKVKGRRFYFLLDKAGRFPNLRLFDVKVGAYRSL